MLCLNRRKNERIMIGDDITILIIDVGEKVVRIGIEAPKHIQVHREEVFDSIQRKKLAGLSGAKAEFDHYNHKADNSKPDDQTLLDQMEDER